jgi:hypothetical protein
MDGNTGSVEADFEEPGVGEEIRSYISRGYNFEQLTKMLGFNPRSVRREMARMLPPASEQEPAAREGKHELMKLGQRDMVAPESIVETLILPRDGETALVWKDGYLSCLYQVFGVARLLQVLSAGQADIVTSQLQLWREARESNRDIALEAAHSAVSQAMSYIDQKLPKAPPPKDMSEMITKRLDKMWDLMDHMMEQRMFPGYQANKPPEGWEYREVPASPAPQGGSPPGWETKQVKEEKDGV